MKTYIIAAIVAISSIAYAGGPGPEDQPKNQCYQKLVTVCPVKKPKKQVAPKPPDTITVFVPKEVPGPTTTVVKEVEVVRYVEVPVQPAPEVKPTVIVGLRLAVGGGFREPYGPEAQVGLRVHVPKFRLGVDVATSFQNGTGAALLVYPYQGEKLNWHVNLGVLGTGNKYLSTTDVPRTWDMTLGTGLEYEVYRHVSITFDWRWAMPSPVFVAENGWPKFANGQKILGAGGRYLDVKQVFGNSFTQSHFLVGLMLRN